MAIGDPAPPRAGTVKPAYIAAGVLLYLGFFSLTKTDSGLEIYYRPGWHPSTAGESFFWLASALILLPATLLLGHGLAEPLGAALARVWARIEALELRARWGLTLAAAALFAVVARVGHAVVLGGWHMTDDEPMARFGGQLLASGRLMVARPTPHEAFPSMYLFARGGKWTSFDFPGVQVAWAISEITHTGPWIFALAAGASVACVAALMSRRLGPAWGAAAAGLFIASPMVMSVSFATHAHVISRAAIAAALLALVRAEAAQTLRSWVLAGLALGVALICRPFETTFLLGPLVVGLAWQEARAGRAARVLGGLALGAAPAVIAFALHSWAITGNPLVPPRAAPNEIARTTASMPRAWDLDRLWSRFGTNSGYNLFMLAVWFLGPLGLWLAALGVRTDAFTKRLGLGIVGLLALGLIHDDSGIHVVGPMHAQEAAVLLTVLAVHGAARLVEAARARDLRVAPLAATLVFAVALSSLTFTAWNARSLRRQARIHETLYGAVAHLHHAVVLAPKYFFAWRENPEFDLRGSQVFVWRRARPDLDDDVLILHDAPGVEGPLRARFADRAFYRMRALQAPPWLEVSPLAQPEAP